MCARIAHGSSSQTHRRRRAKTNTALPGSINGHARLKALIHALLKKERVRRKTSRLYGLDFELITILLTSYRLHATTKCGCNVSKSLFNS